MKGRELRAKGWNRIGNIYVPNENYIKFEAWLQPIITACVREQDEQGTVWTPATFIERLGREINDESSLLFWCTRNHIPVFCPALTDGSIGDNLYFHHATHPSHLHFDIVADIAAVNNLARDAKRTGLLVLGGGAPKHHVCNANLMRNGADFAVYLNTAQEFDGCDSGAAVDEAVSWGKIKADAQSIKVNFPAVGHPHAVGHDHPRSVRAHHPSPPPRVKVPTR
ncbi:deoxyhypusine synthase [Gregarina niphandrodes]|uniref:Deoxyhypusine synthase n=1 Tax=Gregarina niphandrodes TaxID=110365 RepID=A0A023B4Q7_GRENI|nr:deoxyhypusine synthase [Gregarina niphandrodes]EZG57143.1 deoxyhypusine synthase [Gregarina niphandrodes]|eukprot:XP_011131102.1 deoxyhypusine synthase [Gregarina niphandrodes]